MKFKGVTSLQQVRGPLKNVLQIVSIINTTNKLGLTISAQLYSGRNDLEALFTAKTAGLRE